ncbi:SMC family ATPase [Nocardioides kribbensis]|uniref:Nuclease SbcCD subunit C n=1 Tax=Nocardioides kribbensis TaxID=305517 RepID=A0ABV1NUH1_9ACTN
MRLHHLEVTAFGPFADTVSVDFDELSAAGLFLLTGPTGAGKTSVLDAVCFALYGDVPGDRNAARRLRSDHAAEGVAPRVELEATLSGRRFRISRSPQWERPKRRGTGMTTQQASVVIAERVGGQWTTLSTRLDETGQLVTGLVGMNVAQFTQVAMLPQGRFQAFLRARSEERHRLLQQLFRTGRFEDVERWLREHRTALRRDSESRREGVADLVSRVSEAADAALPGLAPGAADADATPDAPPDAPPGAALGAVTGAGAARTVDTTVDTVPGLDLLAADGTLLAWGRDLRALATTSLAATTEAVAAAALDERETREALERARLAAERDRRRRAAESEHRRLVAEEPAQQRRRVRLAEARRAAVVAPLHRWAEESALAADAAERRAAAALGALSGGDRRGLSDGPSTGPSADDLAQREAVAVAAAARVTALVPREERLVAALRLEQQTGAALERLRADLARDAEQAAALPALLGAARERLDAARTAAALLGVVRADLDQTSARLEAALEATRLETSVAQAHEVWLEARETTGQAHERLLSVREARIEAMAAELAGALAVGGCCPVCGSAEHPAKAVAAPGSADAAAEKEAQRGLDDAKADEHVRESHLRDLRTRHALARERSGGETLEALETRVAALREQATTAAAAAAEVESLQTEERRLEQRRGDLADHLQTAHAAVADHEATARAVTAEIAEIRSELAAVLESLGHGDHGDHGGDGESSDLGALLASLRGEAERLREARTALEDLERARVAAADARTRLAETAAEAGFAEPGAALAAVLEEPEVQRLAEDVDAHDRALTRVEDELRDVGPRDGADTDHAAAQRAWEAAEAGLQSARAVAATWTTRCGRLTDLVRELERALEQWAPVRERLELATGLSTFVEGKAADNALQMRLSAYVLAYRLSQVVAAANERLARMSDARYALEHSGRRGAGETRGGLSLLVRDDWSGESRDPATLSGGETFVVSLALALGLADVITQETGGADLDTLFVDEGFGSLDADTLDDVMDVLDSLRDGGRVVGVVSHVGEMRDRITARLQVSKGRSGSTLAVSR